MAFNHFILTRFNLQLWWKEDKDHHAVQTKEWLAERFRLFEHYTLPSLKAQTCPDFQWICLFDDETDEAYKRIISSYAEDDCRFHPVYINKGETRHFQDVFRKEISRWANPNDERLLTTYLDNDDALHCRFVEDVQQRAEKLKYDTILTYIYGIQYYEQMNLAVRIYYKNNHFLTYYERLKSRNRTVWGFWHFSIFKYRGLQIEQIDSKNRPMWVEVIHGRNVDNDVKMTLRQKLLTDTALMHDYGLDINLPSKYMCRRTFLTAFTQRFLLQVARRSKAKFRNGR